MAEQKDEVKSQGVMALDLGTVIQKLLRILRRVLARFVSVNVVTLDISESGVSIMETRGGVIRRWADASFGTEEAEPIGDRGKPDLGDIVRQLMESSGIRTKKVIASISGLYTISRLIPTASLPPAPTLADSIDEIAPNIMPVPKEALYFFWQALNTADGDSYVFTTGVPREVIDDIVLALKAAGVAPQSIELKAMALARAVGKKEALILNIEPTNFDIVIMVKDMPEIMYSLAWRPDNMSLEDTAEYLAAQLDMVIEHYNASRVARPFDMATPLYITGQMSVNPELMEKLQGRLELNIEPLTSPLECPELLPISQYAANIGLAMRKEIVTRHGDAGGLALGMNMLPQIYQAWRPTVKQIYSAVIIIAAIALIFPLWQLADEEMRKTSALEMRDIGLNAQLLRKKAEIERREPLQKAIDEYSSIIVRDRNFDDDIKVIVQEAKRLGVEVSALSHRGKDISVNCMAGDYLSFRNYLTALEESGRFATPIPPPEGYPYTYGGVIKLSIQSGEQ